MMLCCFRFLIPPDRLVRTALCPPAVGELAKGPATAIAKLEGTKAILQGLRWQTIRCTDNAHGAIGSRIGRSQSDRFARDPQRSWRECRIGQQEIAPHQRHREK